eukprot:jgi/Mesvir1/19542/Mv18062-RA.1
MTTSHASHSSVSKDVEILVESSTADGPPKAKKARKTKDAPAPAPAPSHDKPESASADPAPAPAVAEVKMETDSRAKPARRAAREETGDSGVETEPKKNKVMSSSIPELTVGDVRKCLNQIRRKGQAIQSQHLLQNGWTAGDFALKYLLGNSSTRKAGKFADAEEEPGKTDA